MSSSPPSPCLLAPPDEPAVAADWIEAELIEEQPPSQRQAEMDLRRQQWMFVACTAVLAAALVLQVPNEHQVALPWIGAPLPELCTWQRLWGLSCPGCGLTRCFISAAHGNLAAAWRFNPAGLFLFALVAVQPPFRAWQWRRLLQGRPAWQAPGGSAWLWAVAVLLLVQWGVRTAGWWQP